MREDSRWVNPGAHAGAGQPASSWVTAPSHCLRIPCWAPWWAIIVKMRFSSCQQRLSTDFRNAGTIWSRPCQNYFSSELAIPIWWQLFIGIPLGWSDVSSSKDSVSFVRFDWVNTDNFIYAFLPTSSALAKIATPSTVSIGQVRSLHRRFSVYISLCGCSSVWLYFAVLSKIRKRKNVINIDCDIMHTFTNKLESRLIGICRWLWQYSDLLQ